MSNTTYSTNDHTVRSLTRRLRIANKTMGRQGATIANLRGELARCREENSKIDRGELRRLEREQAILLEQATQQAERITALREENKRLHDKLDGHGDTADSES